MNRYKVFTKLNIPWVYRADLLRSDEAVIKCFSKRFSLKT